MDVNYKILIGLILILTLFVNTAQAQKYGFLWSYETDWDVNSVSISSDGSYIAAGSEDSKVYLLDREGNLLWSYETLIKGDSVLSVSISSDGSYIAAGTGGIWSDEVRLLDRERNLLWSYETGGSVLSVSISSDGSYIAAGSDKVYLLDREGNLLWNKTTGGWVYSVSISSDGSYIAAGTGGIWGDKVCLFDKEGNLLWSYETGDDVRSVSISSDGSYIAAGSDDKVCLFDKEGNLLWSYETGGSVLSVSISSDGSYIAAGSDKVYLLDREGNLLWSDYEGSGVNSVSITPNGEYIAVGSYYKGYTRRGVVYLFASEHAVHVIIEEARNVILSEKSRGYNMQEAESLLTQAKNEFKAGDYSIANKLALKAKEKALQIAKQAELSKKAMEEARNTVLSEKNKGYNIHEAESLLSQAEEAFDAGDYKKAKEMAENAKALALDIDQDGVPNDSDFAPTIKNIYVYGAGAVLVTAFAGVGINIKRRKEYQAKVREYKAKYEQLKAEGFEPDEELEELLK